VWNIRRETEISRRRDAEKKIPSHAMGTQNKGGSFGRNHCSHLSLVLHILHGLVSNDAMKRAVLTLLSCLAASAVAGAARIVIGEGQGGWTLGVDYAPIQAAVGDELVRIDCFETTLVLYAVSDP
jgi:hypothetical protein